jgi:F-type H+-transporting ATPase subunit epsilon
MPGHQPLLGVLESGPVTIRMSDGGTVVAAVHGGFISFADNKLSLLAEIAELSDEIDVQRAERALERAKSEADASAERRADVRLRAAAAS